MDLDLGTQVRSGAQVGKSRGLSAPPPPQVHCPGGPKTWPGAVGLPRPGAHAAMPGAVPLSPAALHQAQAPHSPFGVLSRPRCCGLGTRPHHTGAARG